MSRFYVSKYLDTFREECDGLDPMPHCGAVGASRREARQMQDRSVYRGSS